MTSTYITGNSIGPGARFTFAAAGDLLTIVQGVTLASTTASALGGLGLGNLQLSVLGALSGPQILTFGIGANVHVGQTGTVTGFEAAAGSAVLFFSGDGSRLVNDGDITGLQSIGVLADGATELYNSGSVSGSSGVFLGLFGASGDSLVNTGAITANAFADASRDTRFNNGVSTEGGSTLITNLATGVITAISSEGAGVRFSETAGGSVVQNWGQITSQRDFGVNFGTVTAAESLVRLDNWGTVFGLDGSFNGSVNADRVLNRGVLDGDVLMGGGNDTIDTRHGTIDGDWFGGAGDDRYSGGLDTTVFGNINGDAGNDTMNGSNFADVMFGGADNDVLNGFDGADLLYGGTGRDNLRGQAGDDILQGDAGGDVMTGGVGDDTFVFVTASDSQSLVAANRDTILDFVRGQDFLDLTGVDAKSGTAGDQAFVFIGSAAFTSVAGQLRYNAANGLVSGDVDGNGVADFGFVLANGPAVLSAADFLL